VIPLDNYPKLPNAGTKHKDHFLAWMMALVAASVAMVASLLGGCIDTSIMIYLLHLYSLLNPVV
jgi:hypothetical protein